MTIKDLYFFLFKESKKYKISEFDIRHLIIFFQNYKNKNIQNIFLNFNRKAKNIRKIKKIFCKLKKEIPLPYLIHETFFLGKKYFINKNVLIPRVETEELVILFIKYIKNFLSNKKKIKILDIGTGSGIIIIEIIQRLIKIFNIKAVAIDISLKALKVAKKNAKNYKMDKKITFKYANVFPKDGQYDAIITNPPYIKLKNENKNMHKFEPHLALYLTSKNNVYEKIFKKLYDKINRPSLIMFEIDENIIPLLNKLINKYLNKKDFYKYDFDINKKKRFLSLFIK